MAQRSPKKRAARSTTIARAATARQSKKPKASGAPAKRAHSKPPASRAIDARVAAAIAFALRDEEICETRARELADPPSPWTLAARARGVQTRWTR